MSAYSLDLREKIVESVKKGVPKAETARRFGVDRATIKRYCKQLDERGTLESRKAPGKAPKLDEKARKLLLEDLRRRPWATHSQRAEFLYAACGVSVSEATICRTLRRLSHSRKKTRRGTRKGRVLAEPVARGGRSRRPLSAGVRRRDGHSHLPGPLYAYAPVGERAFFEIPRTAARTRRCWRASIEGDGAIHGRGRGDHVRSVRGLRGAGASPPLSAPGRWW